MNKILIKGYFKNSDINDTIYYNTTGYLINKTISFKHDDTKLKIKEENNKIIFIKEDEKTILKNYFSLSEETYCNYYLKQMNLNMDIPILTKKIINKNNIIDIEYYLLSDKEIKNILHIEYEVLT